MNGKYAFYTRPQDGFIEVGGGGGIGWALIEDITQAEAPEEKIIDEKVYHTIKELKNGQGPAPIKTDRDGSTWPTGCATAPPDCAMYSTSS